MLSTTSLLDNMNSSSNRAAEGMETSAPFLIQEPSTLGKVEMLSATVVVNETMSASRQTSSIVSHTSTVLICGSSSFTKATKESSERLPRPLILMVSSVGQAATKAAAEVLPMTPGPTMAATLASFRARWRAPTPGMPPVR